MFIGSLTPEEAMEEMRNGSYQEGFEVGFKIGYEQGYEEGYKIGLEEGLRQAREEIIPKAVEMGLLSASEALEMFGVQVDESGLSKSE